MDDLDAPLPRRVGAKGQVQIPPELMASLQIAVGEYVWIGVNPDRPGTLIVFPQVDFNEVYRKGFTALG